MKKITFNFISIILLFFYSMACAQQPMERASPSFLQDYDQNWVDSVFNSLTPQERIAQLFMVAAYSNRDSAHIKELEALISEHKIGGLIFFQGGPLRQARMCNYLQSRSDVPMLIAMDAEWGLSMRLDSTVNYPRQMTLGAITDNDAIYNMGAEIARQMKRLGVHVSFAPVVDINSNPLNPVIGTRSFGEDKFLVAKKGIAYMKGLQDNGILANAKHFPGHGDTDTDSHKTLPVIKHSTERMDSVELFPFKELINSGVGSMMVAHLYIPAYDDTPNLASTLSPRVVNGLLKDSLGFEGLVFTDALNMSGVSKYHQPGEVVLKALLAGNDVLLFAEDVPTAIDKIKSAIEAGEITQKEIDERCKKILKAKFWVGLDEYKPIELKHLYRDLNAPAAEIARRKVIEKSLTVLINQDEIIPLKGLDTLKIAAVDISDKNTDRPFQSMLLNYADVDTFNIAHSDAVLNYTILTKRLRKYDLVILNVKDLSSRRSQNYGVSQKLTSFINIVNEDKRVILNLFANPYALEKFPGLQYLDGVVLSYEQNETAEEYAAQLIFGGLAASGKLPVTANRIFRFGDGIDTEKTRLGYSIPEEFELASKDFKGIDSIALDAIDKRATPGCQILVAKQGKVIYNKSFGYHTYENKEPVKSKDVYDLASITKIAATLLGIMHLVDKGEINIDDKISKYLPELKGTNKEHMHFREVLAHQAGLKSWIPFYLKTMEKGDFKPGIYSHIPNDTFRVEVASQLYISKAYEDTIYRIITESDMHHQKDYLYSDLGYYYLKKVVEKLTAQPLEEFVQERFYRRLGAETTTFHPREKFKLHKIIPTEYDVAFRKQLVHGYVHDPGAAMLGGVGGHAGLFSNANDLAKLMQMYLNFGNYGGERFLSDTVLKEFTECQYCENENRRGIGFDKPERSGNGGPTCQCVSYMSFGHSGFTGTLAWADPEEEVVYIFLSNRVYPDAENRKLIRMDVRTKIQEVIYDAIHNAKTRKLN